MLKAVVIFKDENGFIVTDRDAHRVLEKELERLESACPRHQQFDNSCGVCERMAHWTLSRKVEFLIDLLLR
jgi:hypothetical protein